ncbi:MAG: hypothetical protein C6Y22_22150 [Hapalosiphonaceae cyanobacterium JJU2]|nr:MAG: hypothetical protein C6Y22_22150 [Hapalosiphonaceae cyanobacterium JJU2]
MTEQTPIVINARLSRIPAIYQQPLGLPLYWRNEESGELPAAIWAYLNFKVDNSKTEPPTQDQIDLITDYLIHYINAPCWDKEGFEQEFNNLQQRASSLRTPDQIDDWLVDCHEIGLDPL